MSYGGYGHAAHYGAMGQHPPPPQGQHQNPYQGQYYGQQQQAQPNVFQINAVQALQFNSQQELEQIFDSKKSQTYNGIQARDLKEILDMAPAVKNYYKISWSLELCKIMITMLDRNRSGILEFPEFMELLRCLAYWLQTFQEFDHNNSGFMEAHELGRCISERFKYQLTPKAMEVILKRYSCAMDDGKVLIALDDFVTMSVRLRAYAQAFRERDRQQHHNRETGEAGFTFDDFLQCTMCL